MKFVFSVCRLVYRRCHNISSLAKLFSSPSQNRASGFPTHGSPICHSVIHLSASDLCSLLFHSLHSGNVSSSAVDRSWGPSLSGHYPTSSLSITAYRSPSLATWPFEHLLLHWCSYSGTRPMLSLRTYHHSPGYSHAVEQLDAVCDSGGAVDTRLWRISCMACTAPERFGPHPKRYKFSELWFRFRASTLHLAAHASLPFRLLPSSYYASERLTRPYSGELPV